MRIAIAGIVHETNTYIRDQTQLGAFQILRGEQMMKLCGTETQSGGAIDTCLRVGSTPVPILWAFAKPSGTISTDAYNTMKTELLERLAEEMPVDGVFLDLHGAGTVDGYPDLEADLAGDIRRLVGEAVPITAAFDLHGNIYRPTVQVESVPILMPTTTTFSGVGLKLRDQMRQVELENPDTIQISFFHGFPYSDVPNVGCHIVITSRAGADQVRLLAKHIGRELWSQRESLRALSLSAEEAVQAAQEAIEKPVVINETSDNCGGGSPGDGTHLLKAMLDAKLKNACFGFIVDAEVADQAHAAGVGSTIEVNLGGKYDDLHGEPVRLNVYVKALHDGRCIMQAMAKGSKINYGRLARLQVEGMDIVVGSRRTQTFDTEPFLAVGIDVTSKDYVALKSSNHFRAGFESLAGTIITADPPGLTTHHIEIFDRSTNDKPLWPIDDNAIYN